ncbi:hypothetical protein G7Z17_g55 [Cylindrodendrum hubeiense]|uniref:Tail specific protease domain-containing protein n=1 Tax=Cylindrodendrum hubeiense TaxID=595255 RepID=A0A9P5HST0_9HYPO|nr:hypothetical protein G7Z17_g55 [Cylindrodendrum hubeiense]
MHSFTIFAGLVLSATASAGVPYWDGFGTPVATPSQTPTPAPYTYGACARIQQIYLKSKAADPSASVKIPPSTALACLRSIDVDVANDIEFIDYVLPFIQFQSTIEYLDNPPSEYLIPGVDLVKGLLEIKSKLLQGAYYNQYQFTEEFSQLTKRVKDGHFGILLPLNNVFTFTPGGGGLVSISEDGCGIPKVYLLDDVRKSSHEGYSLSPITTIDGAPVIEYLESLSSLGGSQDPDALYNEVFEGIPKMGQGAEGLFSNSQSALSDAIVFEFANGTIAVYDNIALVQQDFSEIDSPAALHKIVELPTAIATSTAALTTAVPTTAASTSIPVETTTSTHEGTPTLTGYPYPVEKHYGDWISGYFLNETGYEDVGVLALNGFEAGSQFGLDSTEDLTEFYRTLTSYLAKFEAAGKKKLVVDLQGNGGGFLIAAAFLLHELLPEVVLDDGYRLRATDVLNWIGENSFKENPTLFTTAKDENGKQYKHWEDIFGPQTFDGDDFTHLLSNDIIETTFSNFPDNNTLSTGYLKAEDIIIVTDSVCASSCPLFTGWMSRIGGVRTIAIGGRPLNAPMQAMGGTKGGAVHKLGEIQESISIALNKTDNLVPYALELPSVGESPLIIANSALNTQNQFLPGFQSTTPLQFVYEAANCKLFYTAESIIDITSTWEAVADVAWSGAKCVPGSTVNTDNTISDGKVDFSPAFWSTASWPIVPGGLRTVGGDYYTTNKPYSKKTKRNDLDYSRLRFVEAGPLPEKRTGPVII